MAKALFAGLAGLTAVIAAFQLQGDGGAGAGAPPPDDAASMPPPTVDRTGADAVTAAAAADGGSGFARAALPDAGWRATAAAGGGPLYVGDAPGTLRSEPGAGSADGGSADAGAQVASGDQAAEVRRLQERVARLEQELARARSSAQVQELERPNQQVAALREQLAQEQARRQAEEQARRQAEEQAAQEAKIREQESAAALAAAQQRLATGDSRALEGLESAASALPAPAQGAVNNARTAAQNGDLAMARYWLSVALAQAQTRQVTSPSR
jgi:flagellar biosynthesis GTPase FlhF